MIVEAKVTFYQAALAGSSSEQTMFSYSVTTTIAWDGAAFMFDVSSEKRDILENEVLHHANKLSELFFIVKNGSYEWEVSVA